MMNVFRNHSVLVAFCLLLLAGAELRAQLPVRTQSLQLVSDNNVNIIEHRAPDGITTSFIYTWPAAYPTNPSDNFLISTPTGVLSWANYDGLFWRLDGNAPATALNFLGPTSAGVPLNLASANATPGTIDFYIGPVAAANRRISLSNSTFDVGSIADPVATGLVGSLTVDGATTLTGATSINVTGTANTIIGNTGVGGTTVTLNAGTSGNIILGGVTPDATPIELLTITPAGEVRRSLMTGTAQEGIVYANGAYRLGAEDAVTNPLAVDRFVNINASSLTFTANGGALSPFAITGGTDNSIFISAAGAGNIVMNGVAIDNAPIEFLSITGTNEVRRSPITGFANEGVVYTGAQYRLGGTATNENPFLVDRYVNINASNLSFTANAGAETPLQIVGGAGSGVTLTAAATGNIVMNGLVVDAVPTEFLTILPTGEVRRSSLPGSAQEGVVFTNGAYRLGGTAITENPFLVDRYINVDASSLTVTANNGVNTPFTITGGADNTIGITAAGTGNIIFGGVALDAAPTEMLTITGLNQVRRSPMSGTAQEGVYYSAGAYRLGGPTNADNPFATDRFVNIDASDLAFTANAGGNTPLLVVGGTGSGVTLTAAATGNIVMNGLVVDAVPTEFLTILPTGEVRRSSLPGSADEGVVFTNGAYRLGGTATNENPFDVSRFINIDASNLTITANAGGNTPLAITGGIDNSVSLTAAGAGNIVLGGVATDNAPTLLVTILPTGEVRRSPMSGTAQEGLVYDNGSYRLGALDAATNPFLVDRFVNINGSDLAFTANAGANTPLQIVGGAGSGVTLTAAATGNIVMNGLVVDASPTEYLTILPTGEVRRSSLSGSAQEGVYYVNGAYRLGGPSNLDNPFLINRFVNIDDFDLSFTANGGGNTPLQLIGGANSGVNISANGTGAITAVGETSVNAAGSSNTTIGNTVSGGAISIRTSGANNLTLDVGVPTNDLIFNNIGSDLLPTDWITITPTNQIRRTPIAASAQEGIYYSGISYRLGGPTPADNPFLMNRFVNLDDHTLTFTSAAGAQQPLAIIGGANGGVTMSAIGTGNIVMNNVAVDVAPNELLTINGSNQVRRWVISGTAQEGIYYDNGAYRLGGPTTGDNPFLQNRFVNLDGSDLAFTTAAGANTTMTIRGGADGGLGVTTSGTGTIDLLGPTNVTGTTAINTTGTANTTIGNVGVGSTTVTLNAGATGNIILGGVVADNTPTELLSITASGEVRRTTMSGTAQEGLVYDNGAYRLGALDAATNPFLADRFVNINGSDLAFTANAGAETPLLVVGGTGSGVTLTAAATGNIVMNGLVVDAVPTEFLTILPTGEVRRSSLPGSADEGVVFTNGAYRLGGTATTENPFLVDRYINVDASSLTVTANNGANTPLTITGGADNTIGITAAGTGNIVLGGVATDLAPVALVTILPTGEVRRSPMSGTAQEGLVYDNGAYRLGALDVATNPFLADRFVNINGSDLAFTANAGAETPLLVVGGTGSGVTLTAAATGNIVMNGLVLDAVPTEFLTILPTGEVRRSSLPGSADEGVVFTNGAYRLGGTATNENPFDVSRFINIDASDLTVTANGGANSPLSITGGTANTITITPSATGNVVFNNIPVAIATTDFLTLDASNNLRRAPVAGLAQEGITFTNNAYRLGGETNVANPFLVDRFINVDGSDLAFTANAGAETPLLVVGGTGSGVTLTAAATGNIVMNGLVVDAVPTEFLTILPTGEVRRSSLPGSADEGVVFTNGAYRLGGTVATENPFDVSRFINIDASNLTITANGGGNTPLAITGGVDNTIEITPSGAGNVVLNNIAVSVATTDFLTLDASNNVRRAPIAGLAQEGITFSNNAYRLGGETNVANPFVVDRFVNIDGSDLAFTANAGANTPLQIVGGAGSGVILTAAATGNIVMNGLVVDAVPTEFLTILPTGEVRRSSLPGSADEGVVFTNGAYRLGGTVATENPFDVSRFINIDASDLTITANGGGNTPLAITGGVDNTIEITPSGAGNVVLNNIAVSVATTDFLTLDASNNVRRAPIAGLAQEGITFSNNAYRLGGETNVANPFVVDRFVNIDGSDLAFTANAGANTPLQIVGGAGSGVILTAAATGNIVMNGLVLDAVPTEFLTILPTGEVRRSSLPGSADEGVVFTNGAYRLGGTVATENPFDVSRFINIDASDLTITANGGANSPLSITGGTTNTITITPSATGNVVFNNIPVAIAATDFLTLDASNNLRRAPVAGLAQEGIVFTANAYRLGGTSNTENPLVSSRFINLDMASLSFTANGGFNTPLEISGGPTATVTISPGGASYFTINGAGGVANIRAGSLSAASAAPIVAEGIVTSDDNGDLRRRSASDVLQLLGIGKGIYTPAGTSATHVVSTGTFDLIAGAVVTVTVAGPTGAAVHAMITNIDAVGNQFTVVTSASIGGAYSIHWTVMNP